MAFESIATRYGETRPSRMSSTHRRALAVAVSNAPRVHKNAAVVALANNLARVASAVLRRKETFNPSAMALA